VYIFIFLTHFITNIKHYIYKKFKNAKIPYSFLPSLYTQQLYKILLYVLLSVVSSDCWYEGERENFNSFNTIAMMLQVDRRRPSTASSGCARKTTAWSSKSFPLLERLEIIV
jgi:hypothetical protein